MSVTKERAMQMFDQDLNNFMDEVRGLLIHYSIPDWEAYIFFRKPDCPESYVMKYEATAGDEFAKRIVALHTNTASDSARRAAEEVVQRVYGGDKDEFGELEAIVAAIISKHFAAAPADNDAESKGESNA